jgi:hypothetical protein
MARHGQRQPLRAHLQAMCCADMSSLECQHAHRCAGEESGAERAASTGTPVCCLVQVADFVLNHKCWIFGPYLRHPKRVSGREDAFDASHLRYAPSLHKLDLGHIDLQNHSQQMLLFTEVLLTTLRF